jgi:phosphoesterase RecJ-like protein
MFHADGIVEMGRDIERCEVSVLLKEYGPHIIKVSMRSNAYVDVSEIALLFDGGGHNRAAGCTLNTSLKEAEKIIVDKIRTSI